ncbi:MAG: DegT/DnrJ/EryC1/StrS family aminotransferase [Halioglobus sp.]
MKKADRQNCQPVAAAKPLFPAEDILGIQEAVAEILKSGWLILGEQTRAFEREFQSYVGVDHAVAVSSCTAAIQIALRYYKVQGREVILPTNNFVGVVSAVVQEGASPVMAEMNPETFCVDTDDLLARITPQTAGVVIVHIAGLIYPDIDRLRAECEDRGLFLLEDASHAHGAQINGRRAGGLTEVGCFSFYPTKLVTTGLGGMLTTSNSELADYARSVRHHGVGGSLDDIVNLGNDWCMSEIHAAIGRFQLRRADENVDYRNKMVERYIKGFQGLSWLNVPDCPKGFRHAYYKFPTLLGPQLDTPKFRRLLNEDYGIENGAIYNPPCHLQPVLRNMYGYSEGLFPVAESILNRQLCPPIHSAITEPEVDRAIDSIKAVGKLCGFD